MTTETPKGHWHYCKYHSVITSCKTYVTTCDNFTVNKECSLPITGTNPCENTECQIRHITDFYKSELARCKEDNLQLKRMHTVARIMCLSENGRRLVIDRENINDTCRRMFDGTWFDWSEDSAFNFLELCETLVKYTSEFLSASRSRVQIKEEVEKRKKADSAKAVKATENAAQLKTKVATPKEQLSPEEKQVRNFMKMGIPEADARKLVTEMLNKAKGN